MYKILNLHYRIYGWMNFNEHSCTYSWTLDQQIPCLKFQRKSMRRLSFANRNKVIGLLQAASSKRHVARLMKCSRQRIQSLWRRFQQGQGLEDLPRPDRSPVTTPNQERYTRLQYMRRWFAQAMETARSTGHPQPLAHKRFAANLLLPDCSIRDPTNEPFW